MTTFNFQIIEDEFNSWRRFVSNLCYDKAFSGHVTHFREDRITLGKTGMDYLYRLREHMSRPPPSLKKICDDYLIQFTSDCLIVSGACESMNLNLIFVIKQQGSNETRRNKTLWESSVAQFTELKRKIRELEQQEKTWDQMSTQVAINATSSVELLKTTYQKTIHSVNVLVNESKAKDDHIAEQLRQIIVLERNLAELKLCKQRECIDKQISVSTQTEYEHCAHYISRLEVVPVYNYALIKDTRKVLHHDFKLSFKFFKRLIEIKYNTPVAIPVSLSKQG